MGIPLTYVKIALQLVQPIDFEIHMEHFGHWEADGCKGAWVALVVICIASVAL